MQTHTSSRAPILSEKDSNLEWLLCRGRRAVIVSPPGFCPRQVANTDGPEGQTRSVLRRYSHLLTSAG